MKSLLAALCVWLVATASMQAQILQAEYFFDTDPGVGNGTALAITPGATVEHNLAIDISSLSDGFHGWYVRTKQGTSWGHYELKRAFYIAGSDDINTAQPIEAAEYFFDNDPGVGNGTNIPVTPSGTLSQVLAIDVTGLADGFHGWYVRTKQDGRWGHYALKRAFYIAGDEDISTAQPIEAAEYFFDTDPGVGNGTNIPVTLSGNLSQVLAIDVTGLADGFHGWYVRTKQNGRWGHYALKRSFYITGDEDISTAQPIEAAEYFFDTDPGVGNGFDIPVTPSGSLSQVLAIDVSGLVDGFHGWYVRTKQNGRWGHYALKRSFYITGDEDISTAQPIEAAEYFFDTDPGVGNGFDIPVTPSGSLSQVLAIDVSGLADGFHGWYVRTKQNGRWGHYAVKRAFYINPSGSLTMLPIDRVEGFVNADPGVGQGEILSITPGTTVDEVASISVGAALPGTHQIYVRVHDEGDRISHYESLAFTVCGEPDTLHPIQYTPHTCVNGDYSVTVEMPIDWTGGEQTFSNDQNAQTATLNAGDSFNFGPFPSDSTVIFTGTDLVDTTCDLEQDVTFQCNDCPVLGVNNGDPCTVGDQPGEYVDCVCEILDCNNVPGGTAAIDACGICRDTNDELFQQYSRSLEYSGNGLYVSSVVDPVQGSPLEIFRFEVKYVNEGNEALPPGVYPRVILDHTGNGIFTDPEDRTVLMSESDPEDTDTNDGKIYYAEVAGLATGSAWQTRVTLQSPGCDIELGPFDAPDVIGGPDLQVFASDIVLSNSNPELTSELTVYATVHNNSNQLSEPCTVRLTNQFDGSEYEQPLPGLGPNSSQAVQWTITTPSVDAWCALQVFADADSVVTESNEANNTAVRPFLNGNPSLAGSIVAVPVNIQPVSSTFYPVSNNSVTLQGYAYYEGLPEGYPVTDPPVAGGTVTVQLPQGGVVIGYTNVNGDFTVTIPAINVGGTHTVPVTVTDYTLTSAPITFTYQRTPAPTSCPPWQINVSIDQPYIVVGESISGNIGLSTSSGCDVTTETNLGVFQSGGDPSIGDQVVSSVTSAIPFNHPFSNITFETTGTYSVCATADRDGALDPAYQVSDCAYITVYPDLPDLYPANATGNGYLCNNPPINIRIGNAGAVASGTFDVDVAVFEAGTTNQVDSTQTLSIDDIGPFSTLVKQLPTNPITSPGIYEVHLTCDPTSSGMPTGNVTESNENNNMGVFLIEVLSCGPDLTVTLPCNTPAVNPVDPVEGETVTYSAVVRNIGNEVATAPIEVIFNVNGPISIANPITLNNDLAPGASETVTWTTTASPPATADLLVEVVPIPGELVETNNEIGGSLCWDFVPMRDAACSSLIWYWNPSTINETSIVQVALANHGLYDASEVTVRFEVQKPDNTTLILGDVAVPNVERTCGCPLQLVQLPETFLFDQAGTYTFTFTADQPGAYNECEEDNNVLTRQIVISDLPDLRILSQYINPSELNPDENEPISIDVTYENIGDNNVGDAFDLMVLVDELPFHTFSSVPGLPNGGNNTLSVPITFSSAITGLHIIRAVVDSSESAASGGTVAEANELNNAATRAIIVGQSCDLAVQALSVSNETPQLGSSIQLTADLANLGGVSGTGTVRFYSGADYIGEVTNVTVSPAGTEQVTLDWVVSSNPTTLLARVEDVTPLEYDLSNNEAYASIYTIDLSLAMEPACAGNGAPGSLTVTALGAGPFSYTWDEGSETATLVAQAGDYTVTVTDVDGHQRQTTGTISLDTECDCNGDFGGTAFFDNCNICVGGNTGLEACVQDCNGDFGGTAYVDNCQVCVGGNTNLEPCVQDCNGDYGGTAFFDNCNICVGGNTGLEACVQDCNGDFGGTAFFDECGTCVGGNTGLEACVQDCNGDYGGTAYLDNCDVCVGGNTNLEPCVEDCNGVFGGSAFFDECGTCVGGNTGLEACVQDCNGDYGGTAYLDNCDVCVGGNTNLEPCVEDCNGVFGGSAFFDECGTCVGGNTGLEACVQDCNGDFGGTAYLDNCNVCVGGNTNLEPCVQDCNGDYGGTAYLDNCNVCVGGNTGLIACVQDCNGDFGGTAYVDNCEVCVGGNTNLEPCVQDCNGVYGGTAYLDNCNVCVGGNTNLEPCVQDCNGDFGGTAFLDNCNVCVGGNTNLEPCVQDCNGDYGGTAFFDNCDDCVGGNTGLEACVQDCNGDFGGTAYLDNCDVCVGGNTNLEPCVEDCNGVFGGTAFLDNCNVCVGGNTGLEACVQDCNGDFGGTAYLDNCNVCVDGNTGLLPCVQDCNGDYGGTAFFDNCNVCVGGNTGLEACVQDCNGDYGGTAFFDNCNVCVGGNTGLEACVQDCNGVYGGTAYLDNCNVCVDGNTGILPCVQDCNGDYGGTAFFDNCNICVGGNTGLEACVQDCNGVYGGTAYLDNCNVCVDGNTGILPCVQDCNGDYGGTAFFDNCNICVGGNTGLEACVQDCNGVYGGTAFLDNCNVCVDGNTGILPCVQDCNGDYGGTAFFDNCNVCVGGNTGLEACVQDCNGVYGGTAYLDNCNVCVDGNTGILPCVQDCNGDYGGTAFFDNCNVCVGGNTGLEACVQDCNGDFGGTAYLDNCNVCVGGNTNLEPCVQDCNGDYGGTAFVDECDACVGGNTGLEACVQDCNGDFGGVAFVDECDVCVGGNTGLLPCVQDCNGVYGGTAYLDNCNVCVGGNTNLEPCVQDCNGDFGGTAFLDNCNVCVGGNTNLEPCVQDCNGVYGGTAYLDNCNVCVGGNTNLEPCVQDCNGDFGGTAFLDNCNVCVGGNTGLTACVQDCNGDFGGTAYVDNCEVCVGGNTNLEPCVQDCNGVYGGTAYLDNCNVCVGGNTNLEPCVQDCNGDFGGTAFLDNCNVCVGGNTNLEPCVQDCNGDFGGTAFLDNCNVCVGGNTNLEPCVQDCNGDYGGTAFFDNCDDCVGGNTGLTACVQDCNGDFGGTAYVDNCDVCVGGNTNLEPCVEDCNGVFGGTAFLDNCNVCVGGNTGLEACVQDCNGDFGGVAFVDECDVCVGGNTGLTACVEDCYGDYGGTAFLDNCNVCVGGNTGLEACVQDCNGDFGGVAFVDECDVCVGGNTGLTACVQDCYGDYGGTAFFDNCNICVGGNTGIEACGEDCDGAEVEIQILSSVLPDSNNIVIFDNALPTMLLEEATTLAASIINPDLGAATYQWSVRDFPNGTFSALSGENDAELYVEAYEDFRREYRIEIETTSGCSGDASIVVRSINTACGNGNKKVKICHVPPGNPDNPQTICVSENAVPALLANSDSFIGSCDPDYKRNDEVPLMVNVYPNPTRSHCTVSIEGGSIKAELIQLFDMPGRLIKTINVAKYESSTYVEVDISIQHNGVYILNVIGDSQIISTNLVVKTR